ncbi:hypothetical protein PGT21_001581 [Puccinia graminis f. sp. tritici]|uniref:Uncharacterized protein n=1 Tax=Puccinia graminis f. sp. tritici TaxID=56615 RepID=A0A5B0N710_PUCGR|nr:hypothetical protein PGT21_001581 [Puccinia graminis f. sp. tritici]
MSSLLTRDGDGSAGQTSDFTTAPFHRGRIPNKYKFYCTRPRLVFDILSATSKADTYIELLMVSSSFLTALILLPSLVYSGYSGNIDTTTVEQCYFYTGANSRSATCSGRSEFKCTGGCAYFVKAQGCQPKDSDGSNASAPTTQTCDVEFSMITPRVKSCVTSAGVTFSCSGDTSGIATCSQCLKAREPNPASPLTLRGTRPRPI